MCEIVVDFACAALSLVPVQLKVRMIVFSLFIRFLVSQQYICCKVSGLFEILVRYDLRNTKMSARNHCREGDRKSSFIINVTEIEYMMTILNSLDLCSRRSRHNLGGRILDHQQCKTG